MSRIILEPDPRYRYPINGAAARVLRPAPVYESNKKILTADQSTPFRLRTIERGMRMNASFRDLTGVRFGRLTVCGMAEGHEGKWACRCDCGTYTLRKKGAIVNPLNHMDRCEMCRQLAFLRREDNYRQTGRDREWGK